MGRRWRWLLGLGALGIAGSCGLDPQGDLPDSPGTGATNGSASATTGATGVGGATASATTGVTAGSASTTTGFGGAGFGGAGFGGASGGTSGGGAAGEVGEAGERGH